MEVLYIYPGSEDQHAGLKDRLARMAKVTIIQSGVRPQYWHRIKECFQYRDLLRMLCYRDLRVRYAQTFLGITWALINPLVSTLVLYFVFSVITHADTQDIPPILYTLSGLYAWNYFSRVVSDAGNSIIGAQALVKKVYFPRLIIPWSKAISALIDLGIVLILLLVMLWVEHYPLHWQMLMIIPFTLLTFLTSIAFGTWISALTIRYRDFNHILPLALRIGIFISPIAYSSASVPGNFRWLYNLNPLTGIIEGVRWSLFNTAIDLNALLASIGMTVIVLFGGIAYFIMMEREIADII
ncbi:MAG TPA: ABC transporter permease [Saprospiraceae bacterium]|nr:ABC transporter permease [Saprospiraceae bacterium]